MTGTIVPAAETMVPVMGILFGRGHHELERLAMLAVGAQLERSRRLLPRLDHVLRIEHRVRGRGIQRETIPGALPPDLPGSTEEEDLSEPEAPHRAIELAEKVLAAVPETHTPACAALKIAGTPAHVESSHALILVPSVHHSIYNLIL